MYLLVSSYFFALAGEQQEKSVRADRCGQRGNDDNWLGKGGSHMRQGRKEGGARGARSYVLGVLKQNVPY